LKNDYEKADFFTQVAMKKKPNYAAAYDNLGQIAFEKGDIALAKENFEKALEIKSTLPDSLFFMGLVLEKEKLNQEALTHLRSARDCHLDGLNTITYEMIDAAIDRVSG
jgi:tetratricopeptide (TPR) repeat protein